MDRRRHHGPRQCLYRRLSGPDNLINCDIVEGPLDDVTAMPAIVLRCALIEEGMEIEVNP